MGPVGTPRSGCTPNYNATNIGTQEKTWDLGEWIVAEQICYKDLKETLVRYAMRKKTDIADLTGTDYMDIIVEPTMQAALEKMMWRMSWFGSKTAKNFADGGSITDGVDPALFQVCDGLFSRIYQLPASQRVTIGANTASSYAAQISGVQAEGVATQIFNDLIYNADMRLRQASDKQILVTQTLADALAIDVKRTTGSDLQWESLFDGLVSAAKWNGETILALPRWDEMIRSFEDNGTVWNKPHRAVYASLGTLWCGVPSTDMIADLQVWFEKKDQINYMIASDEVGTMIWEDNLVMAAY